MNIERIFRWSPYYYERVEGIVFWQNRLDFLSINFPPLCNYNCSFCFAADSLNTPTNTRKRELVPIEIIIETIESAHQYWLRHIEISWEWEPLLPMFRTYLYSIIKTASELGIHVTIFTNGSLLDTTILSFLNKYNTSLIISIKYFNTDKYNKNVGRKTFDLICRNIQLVQKLFSRTDNVDNYRIYNFWLFSWVFENNEADNQMIREFCDKNDIFFSLSSQIPQWKLADTTVDFVAQDLVVDQYQHNSIILSESSASNIWFPVCWTFYYGIWINCYGDWLFDAHSGIVIGNISQMWIDQAVNRQRSLINTLFTEYNCKSYCPLRDKNYQSFLENHLNTNL
jgi:sulfatase maturation enzyme AslB (radical SAM superfamily)